MPLESTTLLAILGVLCGGGGVAALLKSRSEGKLLRVQASSLSDKNEVEVESVAVTTLQQVIKELREHNAHLIAQNTSKDKRIAHLEHELAEILVKLQEATDRTSAMIDEISTLKSSYRPG